MHRLALAANSLHSKLEMPRFASATAKIEDGPKSLTGGSTMAVGPHDALCQLKSCPLLHNSPKILFEKTCNRCTVSGMYQDNGRKSAYSHLPQLYLASPVGMISVEFQQDVRKQKTRVFFLSCGVVGMSQRLAVLVQYWLVTDRRKERRTQSRGTYRTSIASCGKYGSEDSDHTQRIRSRSAREVRSPG